MRILITAGGTREYIDPVRFISNASSGRMGYALARAALKAGHKVTLITAPTSLRVPDGVRVVRIETAAEMFDAVKKHFEDCDCLIMAAAVADYTPVKKSKTKIKKSKRNFAVKLKKTADILRWAGKHKNKRRASCHGQRIIAGFALEDRNLRKNAEKKLKEKNLDMIVANTTAAIDSERSSVQVKTTESDWIDVKNKSKTTIAKGIISLVETISL
jgi:phosphopantothenoylcysteine decarboxylase/phosphopantothenate--cysteine ligase